MLLDTSGLLCLFDGDDFRHAEAERFYDSARNRLTHNYVLAEAVPLFRSRGFDPRKSLALLSDLLESPEVEVAWVDETIHRAALSVLQARLDKGDSLCDAVSFVLMRQRGIAESLTTDRHFSQEGFVQLLPP